LNTDLAPWEERWVLLGGSVLLACLVAWMDWAIRQMGGAPQRWYQAWRRWHGRPWIEQTARFLYTIGVPAAALLWRGVLKESALGLQPFPWQSDAPLIAALPGGWDNWLRDLLWMLALGAGMALLVAAAGRTLKRAGAYRLTLKHDGAVALREAAFHEAHWAFYREPFILLWGTEIGAWAGAFLALLEAAVNPACWARLRDPAASRDLVLRLALGAASTLLFLLTQNFWLTVLLDAGLGWWWGIAHPRASSPGA